MATTVAPEWLRGIWAALPVPWNETGDVDADTLFEDAETLGRQGAHGIYTGGTTGEFYAQDDETFARITRTVLEAGRVTGTPVQIGCTALSTRLVCRRIAVAVSHGAAAIQLALPCWLPLTDREVVDFYADVRRAAGNTPLVHYETDRAKRRLSAELFARVRDKAPSLVGCKFTGDDQAEARRLVESLPEVHFFVGEQWLADMMQEGAVGSCSCLVLMNPGMMRRYFDLCRQRDWNSARVFQAKIARLFTDGIAPLRQRGLQDSAFDRTFTRVGAVLGVGLRVQRPYSAATEDEVACVRRWIEENAPELLEEFA